MVGRAVAMFCMGLSMVIIVKEQTSSWHNAASSGLPQKRLRENCTAVRVNEWLEKTLLPKLTNFSVIVMDNAPFHKKDEIKRILKKAGHVALFLPPYSPDLNPIEKSFGVIKRKREFAPPKTPILDIITSSECYWE
jgi:transposase